MKTGDLEEVSGVTGLASWSESSLYVQRSNALHPSRPSSFGPHITTDSLNGLLFPISTYVKIDSYGCSNELSNHTAVPDNWIALIQRGKCPFSDKVRLAQKAGAIAVIFGDQSYEDGGIGGAAGGLLTPLVQSNSSSMKF